MPLVTLYVNERALFAGRRRACGIAHNASDLTATLRTVLARELQCEENKPQATKEDLPVFYVPMQIKPDDQTEFVVFVRVEAHWYDGRVARRTTIRDNIVRALRQVMPPDCKVSILLELKDMSGWASSNTVPAD